MKYGLLLLRKARRSISSMKNERQIILVAIFSVLYITTSFFAANSVTLHTLYGLFIISILFSILHEYLPKKPQWSWLKIALVFFWIGQSAMYIINFFLYSHVTVWLGNFNNYMISIPVYVVSLLIAVMYVSRR